MKCRTFKHWVVLIIIFFIGTCPFVFFVCLTFVICDFFFISTFNPKFSFFFSFSPFFLCFLLVWLQLGKPILVLFLWISYLKQLSNYLYFLIFSGCCSYVLLICCGIDIFINHFHPANVSGSFFCTFCQWSDHHLTFFLIYFVEQKYWPWISWRGWWWWWTLCIFCGWSYFCWLVHLWIHH